MIIRVRKKPLILQKLDAIIPRLSPHFPKLPELRVDAAKRYKGYIGERKVDYQLEYLTDNYIILQDINLRIQGKSFQIDTIVISPHAIFCIEIKNFEGTITFNTNLKQFTRNNDTREEGYRYPITQAETHQHQLTEWLHRYKFKQLPIFYLIAISDPSTIINVIGDEQAIAEVVAHSEYLPKKIMDIDERLKSKGNNRLNAKAIGAAILKECKEHDRDVIRQYGITPSDIRTGVMCPSCGNLGMERGYDKWSCPRCDGISKHAHITALNDYLLLANPWITN